jgi:hypothetical protein
MALIHIVEQGQTLWDIASAIRSLQDLYAGMNDKKSVIFPGERVLTAAQPDAPWGLIVD